MDFESYMAESTILYFHLREYFNRYKSMRLNYLLDYNTKDDMVVECWIEIMSSHSDWAIECREYYNEVIVENYELNRRTRQRLKIAVKNIVSNKYHKQKRENKMKRNIAQNIDRVTGPKVMSLLFAGINLTSEENTLIYWKMDMLDDKDAMDILRVSRATLFNRWNRLKERIVARYNENPLKSLELFSRVSHIRNDMMEMEGE
jgi:hypothetical protein